ncbi:MAG: siderophore-interacting protein [Bifidobacterium sp.]|nr:siderophore-interacting protein [Bifidobacterium sp.]
MNRGLQGVVLKAMHAPEFRLAAVSTALECGGLMKRVSFSSPDQLPESLFEPAAWMRLWFPVSFGREVQRGYTVAGYALDHSRVDVSFYLHQTSGPAASWALHVHAGSMLNANIAGSQPCIIDERCRGVLLVGDETAFPAIRTIVGSLPERTHAYVLLTGAHDLTDFIAADERVKVWYAPTQKALHVFAKLKDKLQIDSAEPGAWHCWAAGESAMMRAIRSTISHGDSLPKSNVQVRGYWTKRRIMGL